MIKKALAALGVLVLLLLVYLFTWPVPISPEAWESPTNPGYTGDFKQNTKLSGIEKLPLGGHHGPEDIAIDGQGRIYAPTLNGHIVRLKNASATPEEWANTGGRPLGIEFAPNGNLMVADGYKGLLAVSPDGKVRILAQEANGTPIAYADDVGVASDGKIYFSDASTKFSPREFGGTFEASMVDIMEHGGHGRLLEYDPKTGNTKTLIKGLNFANGVAVSPEDDFVLVNETGSYQVLRYWLKGPKKGTYDIIIDNLPGFPDNISPGLDGRFWIALVSPRNPILDSLSEYPFLRKVIPRIPEFLRPSAQKYGHIIAIDKQGRITQNLQDPDPAVPLNTGVAETRDYLYIGSLATEFIPRLDKSKPGL